MPFALWKCHVVARAWYVCDGRHVGLGVGGCTPKSEAFLRRGLAVGLFQLPSLDTPQGCNGATP